MTSTCRACPKPVKAAGLCGTHYQRQYRHGGLESRQGQRPPIHPGWRFLSKIEKQPNGCWHWTDGLSQYGYGKFKVNEKTELAHRFAWFLVYGVLSSEEETDHLCHTLDKACIPGVRCPHRRCVNPDHLEVVTTQENIKRRDERKRNGKPERDTFL